MKHLSVAFLTAAFSLALTSCADSPERAAKQWLQSFLKYDGNALIEKTCAAQVENVQTAALWSSAFAVLPQLFGLNLQSNSDLGSVHFVTTRISGSDADVRVFGELRVAVLAYAQAYPVDETWRMRHEQGKWKWCGIP